MLSYGVASHGFTARAKRGSRGEAPRLHCMAVHSNRAPAQAAHPRLPLVALFDSFDRRMLISNCPDRLGVGAVMGSTLMPRCIVTSCNLQLCGNV